MTIAEIYNKITAIRDIRNDQDAYDWIWVVDESLWQNLYSRTNFNEDDRERFNPERYIYGQDDDKIVLADDEYMDLYKWFVLAQDDLMYQDMESYSNNMILYNSMLDELKREWRYTHTQKLEGQIKGASLLGRRY